MTWAERERLARQLAFAGMTGGWRWGDWEGLTPMARAYWRGRADEHALRVPAR